MEKNKSANRFPRRFRGTDSATIVELIETVTIQGNGTKSNPFSIVKQYWSLDGKRLWAIK